MQGSGAQVAAIYLLRSPKTELLLGGMAFGAAWIALLAIAHVYQSTEDIRPRQFTFFMASLIVVAGSVHIGFHHAGDVYRYSSIAKSFR